MENQHLDLKYSIDKKYFVVLYYLSRRAQGLIEDEEKSVSVVFVIIGRRVTDVWELHTVP